MSEQEFYPIMVFFGIAYIIVFLLAGRDKEDSKPATFKTCSCGRITLNDGSCNKCFWGD